MRSDYYGMPVSDKKKFWEEQFQHWQESGLSQNAFCKQHEIKPHLWFYWKRVLNKKESGITFVPLRLSALSGQAGPIIRVIAPNGFRIEIENPGSILELIREVAVL
jgi:hypothetical protein